MKLLGSLNSLLDMKRAKPIGLTLLLMSMICSSVLAQNVAPNDYLYWLRYRTHSWGRYYADFPVTYNKQAEYAKSRNLTQMVQKRQYYRDNGKPRTRVFFWEFAFDTTGRITAFSGGRDGKPAKWSYAYTYNDKGNLQRAEQINRKGQLTKVTQHDYYTQGDVRLHFFELNKKGDTTQQNIQGSLDTITLRSKDYYYKKGKLKYTWVNEYYPNKSAKQTTLYNAKGQQEYVWSFECKEEGVEILKHKDTSTICTSKEYDADSTVTEVSLATDSRGKLIKTVKKRNKYGNLLVLTRSNETDNEYIQTDSFEYDENGKTQLKHAYQNFYNGKITGEWVTHYDTNGNVTAKNVKRYKKGILDTESHEVYTYDNQNRPSQKEVLLADGKTKELIRFSYE